MQGPIRNPRIQLMPPIDGWPRLNNDIVERFDRRMKEGIDEIRVRVDSASTK